MLGKQEINTTIKNLAIVAVAALVLYLVWELASFILLLITALILFATLSPLVDWLAKKMNKRFAAAVVTIALVAPVAFGLAIIIPVFLHQLDNIAMTLTKIIGGYANLPPIFRNIDITQYTENAGSYLWTSTRAFTNFVAQIIILIFMVYYLLVDADELNKLLAFFIPKKSREKANKTLKNLAEISGQYIRGNLLISLICGTFIFLGLWLLGVPGAAALAVFTAITDLLPVIGAAIGAVPAIILALTVSPLTGAITVVLYWVYQEFENHILIPRVYHSALKIIPFLSFVAVIVGTMLFGVAGAFLALPVAASIPAIIAFFSEGEKSE
jgi:predicted PurR-regulated permease PerM